MTSDLNRITYIYFISFIQSPLTDTCLDHMRSLIHDAALDYQQDPQLMEKCSTEVEHLIIIYIYTYIYIYI